MKLKNTKAVTLMEMLVVIVILGVCSLPLMAAFSQVLKASANNLMDTTLVYLAEGKMEEMLSWNFFDLEKNDAYGNDGSGATGTFTAPLNNYSWQVDAFPINPDCASNLKESGCLVPNASQGYVGGNYLRIYVKAWRTATNRQVELWAILTPGGSKYWD